MEKRRRRKGRSVRKGVDCGERESRHSYYSGEEVVHASGGIRGDSYILLLPILRVARSNRALIFSTLHSHSTALLLLHLYHVERGALFRKLILAHAYAHAQKRARKFDFRKLRNGGSCSFTQQQQTKVHYFSWVSVFVSVDNVCAFYTRVFSAVKALSTRALKLSHVSL